MTEETNKLTVLTNASRMLAEIRTVDDARHLMGLAEAARAYAKEINLGLDVQNLAAEIKLRSQRKAGAILIKMAEMGERNTGGQPTAERSVLKDLGISKGNALTWQYFARVPGNTFENAVKDVWDEGDQLTTWGIYNYIKRLDPEKKKRERAKTKEDAFTLIKEAIQTIKDNILIIKSTEGTASYFLRWIIQALTDIAVGLVKEGYDYDPGG